MKKVGNINNIPIVQGRNNEIKNQIKAEINIDGTLSFKKRNSLGGLTPLTYIDVQGNNAKSRRKVGELFNKPLISSPTRLLRAIFYACRLVSSQKERDFSLEIK